MGSPASPVEPKGRSFVLELHPEGDGGAYRIRNALGEINRPNIVDRGDSLVVQADLVAAIHGKVVDRDTPKGGTPATLVVTDFWFIPGKQSRRFTWAQITYRFGGQDESAGLSVANIAPKGRYSLHPVPVHVEKESSADFSIQAPVGPVTPGLSFGWALKKTYDTTDQVSLSGVSRLTGRDFGPKDTAVWSLESMFHATVDIQVDADLVSNTGFAIKRLLGKIPKDDPVMFDSKTSLESDEIRVDIGDLGANLGEHSRVETTTKLRGDGTLAEAKDDRLADVM